MLGASSTTDPELSFILLSLTGSTVLPASDKLRAKNGIVLEN